MIMGWYSVFWGESAEIWGQDSPWERMVLQDPEMTESSGLAESSRAGIFWSHNDSGDHARLFAVEPNRGTLGQVLLDGIEAVDWEALGTCNEEGKNWIVVADCGDNQAKRNSIQLYKFLEPEEFKKWTPQDARSDGNAATVARKNIQQIEVTFVDGPRDCEAIFLDPKSSRIVLLAKSFLPIVGVYAVPIDFGDRSPTIQTKASRICTINIPMATDMAINRENGEIVVASYLHAFYFPVGSSKESLTDQMKRLPLLLQMPPLKQIEACTFDREGNLWVSSEGDPLGMAKLKRESIEELKRAHKEKP
jgi:hypothetical protein